MMGMMMSVFCQPTKRLAKLMSRPRRAGKIVGQRPEIGLAHRVRSERFSARAMTMDTGAVLAKK